MERTPVSAESPGKTGLSVQAQKLKALLSEWRKDRDPELNRAFALFAKDTGVERKRATLRRPGLLGPRLRSGN